MFFSGRKAFDTPVATYVTLAGKTSTLLGRRPNDGWNANAMFDYNLSKSHVLRVGYSQNYTTRSNLGIGGFDLAERAYSSETSGKQVRMQETGPIGGNMFLNTRLQLRLFRSESASVLEAQTIRVLDGVTRGGAQVAGGVNQKDLELSSDLNYVRGIHTVRTGIALEGGTTAPTPPRIISARIFSNGETFLEGRPRNYTRRIGDPLITYDISRRGHYVQDDIRLRPNLTFSPGLRYEVQTHVHDWTGFGLGSA
jgi:hypothetical protein